MAISTPTERLYYGDSYTLEFEAQVVERTSDKSRPTVVLDRTYFYPEGGGQPHDTGTINGVRVVDVQTREPDRAVLHILERELLDNRIEGKIDAERRFDFMQHHSGQHVLSQALERAGKAPTVSVHMSSESMTIDVRRINITPEEWIAIEDLANRIVLEDLVIRAWFPDADELKALALRKLPDVAGKVRVVDVGGFDITACGGTHVARSGEIGLIKVVKFERRGDTTRLEFRCGKRSIQDYRDKNDVLNRLTAAMTVGYWELPDAFTRLQNDNKALRNELKALREELIDAEAQAIITGSSEKIIARVFEGRDVNDLKLLSQKILAHPGKIVLFGIPGDKAQLLFGRSEDISLDIVPVFKKALALLGSERGGGRPNFAQGGGVSATAEQIRAALQEAEQMLAGSTS